MAKTMQEIAAKVQEIYSLARVSDTPINVLSLQSTLLLGNHDWLPAEVEKVGSDVIYLLVENETLQRCQGLVVQTHAPIFTLNSVLWWCTLVSSKLQRHKSSWVTTKIKKAHKLLSGSKKEVAITTLPLT